MPSPLAVRALDHVGCPWAPHAVRVGLLRDEIAAWRPPSTAELLRVTVPASERDGIADLLGDWFVAHDRPTPVKVPTSLWDFDDAARDWAAGRPLVDLWEGCTNARWMLEGVTLPRRWLVRVACALVTSDARAWTSLRPALRHDLDAVLVAARAWACGTGSPEAVQTAVQAIPPLQSVYGSDPFVPLTVKLVTTLLDAENPHTVALGILHALMREEVDASFWVLDVGWTGRGAQHIRMPSGSEYLLRTHARDLQDTDVALFRMTWERQFLERAAHTVRATVPLDVVLRAACDRA